MSHDSATPAAPATIRFDSSPFTCQHRGIEFDIETYQVLAIEPDEFAIEFPSAPLTQDAAERLLESMHGEPGLDQAIAEADKALRQAAIESLADRGGAREVW